MRPASKESEALFRRRAGSTMPLLLLAACLLPSLVSAQWIDTTLYIPDSMTGLAEPTCLARNSLTHTLYVGGENDNVVFAIDDRTGLKLARIPLASGTYNLACDCMRKTWSIARPATWTTGL